MPDIGEWLENHWDEAEHAVIDHLPHHHGKSQAPAVMPVTVDAAAPAARTEENTMGFITDVRNEIAAEAHNLAAHAVTFEQTVLPGIAGKLTALEGNPVVDSLLNAVHVPPEALAAAVQLIDKLEELYNPAPAQAAAPVQPQPVPAQ